MRAYRSHYFFIILYWFEERWDHPGNLEGHIVLSYHFLHRINFSLFSKFFHKPKMRNECFVQRRVVIVWQLITVTFLFDYAADSWIMYMGDPWKQMMLDLEI